MSISLGPYKTGVPVVTIQDIRLDNDLLGNYTVEIGLSNERIYQPNQTPRSLKFGNFIYFTESKEEINDLSSNEESLIELIKKNPTNKFYFNVDGREFVYKTDAEDSKKIYSFFHQKRFRLENTENLYVLVCSYTERKNNILLGRVAKETIVENNISPIFSSLYTLSETVDQYGSSGSVWPGGVHEQNNNLMAGNVHVVTSHPSLNAVTAANVRLKDMRVISAANSLDFRYEKAPESYFSPITLSRGRQGNINGAFTFNLLNFAKNNTKFGGLIKDNDSLISSVEIKDIIIYQRIVGRDAQGNALTPGKTAHCGLKDANPFKRVASLNNNCSVVSNTTDNEEVLEVIFLDDTTSEVNSGEAEYKAEITFNDKTEVLILDSLLPLKRDLSNSSGILQAGGDVASQELYARIIVNYLTSIQVIFGSKPFEQFSIAFWRKNLLALVNKFNPNYDSDRFLFLTTINRYVSNIESLTQPYKMQKDSFDINSKIYVSKTEKVVKAVKQFTDKLIFTGTKNYGFDYIDQNLGDDIKVIPNVSFDVYRNRANEEVSKYEIINTQASALNMVGFLSPQSIELSPVKKPINTKKLNISNNPVLSAVQSKIQSNVVLNVGDAQIDNDNKKGILSDLGVSIKRNPISLKKITGINNRRMAREIIDSSEYLSLTSHFVYENKDLISSGSTESSVEATTNTNVLDTLMVDNFVDQSILSFATVDTISNDSQLSGSPALFSFEQNNSVLQDGSGTSKAVNFNSVAQVQYLDSYDLDEGVAKQNWKLLTKQKFDSSVNNSRPLLCKLVKVSNTIGTTDILDLKPMSSLFVIGDPEVKIQKADIDRVISTANNNVHQSDALIGIEGVEILYSKNVPLIIGEQQDQVDTSPEIQQNSSSFLFNIGRSIPSIGY